MIEARYAETAIRRLCQQRNTTLIDVARQPGEAIAFAITNDVGKKIVRCKIGLADATSMESLIGAVSLELELGIAALGGAEVPMVCRGTFRVYFNRHGAAPFIWCVATDQWELACEAVTIRTEVGTRYQPKPMPDDEDGRPSAWIVATGVLTIRGGEAVITSAAEVQHP